MAEGSKHRDLGLFLLRIGMGAMFVYHGVPKLLGGPALWEKLGHAMRHLGVELVPTFWGFFVGPGSWRLALVRGDKGPRKDR